MSRKIDARIYGAEKNDFDRLIDETVLEVRLDSEKQKLVFVIKADEPDSVRTVSYEADGDCCSHSWIEHMNGVQFLVGHKVIGIIERDLSEHDDQYGELQHYGWTIETNAGRFDLEMRNESNGYYGGRIVAMNYKDPFLNTEPITEDF